MNVGHVLQAGVIYHERKKKFQIFIEFAPDRWATGQRSAYQIYRLSKLSNASKS